jgi:hypothetical protein
MKALLKIATFVLLCSVVLVKPKTIGERFIYFANTYNTDSLSTILADDFILKRNFTTFTNDRQSYLTNYTRNAARLHGRFDIISKTGNGNSEVFLVENSSDVFTYLLDEKAKWQLSVHINKSRLVDIVQIDTVAGFPGFIFCFAVDTEIIGITHKSKVAPFHFHIQLMEHDVGQ